MHFYDSNTGRLLFSAPSKPGRSMEDFLKETRKHGWPSFRDPEVCWKSVHALFGGEVVSIDGTHLGHDLPDYTGNRYCINVASIAGRPRPTYLCPFRMRVAPSSLEPAGGAAQRPLQPLCLTGEPNVSAISGWTLHVLVCCWMLLGCREGLLAASGYLQHRGGIHWWPRLCRGSLPLVCIHRRKRALRGRASGLGRAQALLRRLVAAVLGVPRPDAGGPAGSRQGIPVPEWNLLHRGSSGDCRTSFYGRLLWSVACKRLPGHDHRDSSRMSVLLRRAGTAAARGETLLEAVLLRGAHGVVAAGLRRVDLASRAAG
mmetsp:Transcript_44974/g.143421  ORF Transcript_44974/g.143421 Transcript_44974/m.143421 type:complete len:315 (+) Transcript_44974:121-1065(+)